MYQKESCQTQLKRAVCQLTVTSFSALYTVTRYIAPNITDKPQI